MADDEWGHRFVRRILRLLGIVAVGILLSAMIFITLRSLESKNAEASFNVVAQERLDALETNITLTINNPVSVGALYDASHYVEREEFERFAVPLLAGNRAIQALEWIPRVPRRSRQAYEENARHDGFPSFEFTERPSPAQLVSAKSTSRFFTLLPSKVTKKPWASTLLPTPFAGKRSRVRQIPAGWWQPAGSSWGRRPPTNTASLSSVRFTAVVSSRLPARDGVRR